MRTVFLSCFNNSPLRRLISSTKQMPIELPVLTVIDATAWSSWLARSATTSKGVWLTLAKKGNTTPTSLTYAQALDEALCQGWIDGQARGGDERTYSQRFTPRTAKSLWSRRNVDNVARLKKEGRITAVGYAAINAAKADGRWEAAYAGQSTAEPPPEFLAAVAAVPAAQATWDALSRSNRFAIYFRLNALKTQAGKEKRMAAFVEMLARGETLLPQKQKPPVSKQASRAPSRKKAGSKEVGEKPMVATRTRTSPGDSGIVRRSARLQGNAAPSS
ncbi:hypothetical protein F5B22DRAFT_592520 [Xylaria bambusicola]|uniref:uncharacterized protein n=1 Tax=Xylaria bambusicola TaxID=326684 RepID=UPI002007EB2C|nr:uncharacterized protein F5B22DRAFT_592520 [Xylaria bambusicola]KAI0523926.1 hypothetical protein F5B22DRAFT_592520 [Xylaria bambusicola]